MPEPIVRAYRMEDELLLTRSESQKSNLSTDLPLFTARFPWINAAYVTSYSTDIDTANAFPLDDVVMTDIKVLSADVNASVIEGKSALNTLFLFSEIIYPTDIVKQRVFGQDQMKNVRNDQEKMMNLLEKANSFADKNPFKADLLGRGYTQVEIDGLKTIAVNIRSKNLLQENAKGSRPVTTQQRIQVYNTVFERMRIVYKCAQVVFVGNPAKIEQYRVYPPGGSTVTTVEVKTKDSVTGLPVPDVTVKLTNTALDPRTSDAGGITQFDLGSTDVPDVVDIEVSGEAIATQTFPGNAILAGEENFIELQVVV